MTVGLRAASAYQQTNQSWLSAEKAQESEHSATVRGPDRVDAATAEKAAASKPEVKAWKPLDAASSLIPQKGEYGFTVGEVKLSDKAKEYYKSLKEKFHNLDFILVSKDMKKMAAQNAASYGNAQKLVVLIDEEKIERMANDEAYRKKYEGIIAMSQAKITEAKNSLASSGAAVKNVGMSVDENGNAKFFATLEKSADLQKERIERKVAEKREQKAKERKDAAKEAREERLTEAREARKAQRAEALEKEPGKDRVEGEEEEAVEAPKEYVMFEGGSIKELLRKVQTWSYENLSGNVRTDAELALGGNIDFKG
ncbi:MAG: hypothetical protein IKR61_10175 [Lachnospiraceae bacterium]|nr:hypothetical protein [Lachnospiraceae bacterium]